MTFPGTVVNGVVVLDPPQQLTEGTRVEVVIREPLPTVNEKQPTLAERLLKHAGTVTDLPSDMAEQHDHYIRGTPKR